MQRFCCCSTFICIEWSDQSFSSISQYFFIESSRIFEISMINSLDSILCTRHLFDIQRHQHFEKHLNAKSFLMKYYVGSIYCGEWVVVCWARCCNWNESINKSWRSLAACESKVYKMKIPCSDQIKWNASSGSFLAICSNFFFRICELFWDSE